MLDNLPETETAPTQPPNAQSVRSQSSSEDPSQSGAEALNAKASIATVDTLFHNQLYDIPTYQREFSWGPPQIEALIGDLTEAFHARDVGLPTPQYFLGAIVTQVRPKNESGEIDLADKIVDGQQRVTALMLIIAVLCKHLNQTDGDTESEPAHTTEQTALLNLIYRPDQDNFLLDVEGYNYFLRQLMGGKAPLPKKRLGQPPFKTAALQKLIKAFHTFEDILLREVGRMQNDDEANSEPDLDQLSVFGTWLRHSVFIALIADTDPYDDQRLFDRMNTRGLPLSEGDRFKSRVLAALNSGAAHAASARWQKNQETALQALNIAAQSGSLAIRDTREAERRLLGGWLIASQVDLAELTAAKVRHVRGIILDPYDFCLNRFSNGETGEIDPSLFNTLKASFFSCVRTLHKKKAYLGVYEFQPDLAGLQHAQIQKLPYLDVAIAACMVKAPARQATKRLKILAGFLDVVSFHRAWNRDWAHTRKLDEWMLGAAHAIKTTQLAGLRGALATLLGTPRGIDPANAPGLISANQRWIRYALGRMAYELETRAIGKPAPLEYINGKGRRAPEIEHIFSKRYNDDGSTFGYDRKQIEADRQRLGALTLLAREENRGASNIRWSERTKIYATSNLLTRTLAAEDVYNNVLELKSVADEMRDLEFQPWDKISPEAIDTRERAYTNLARIIWSKAAFMTE